MRERARTSCGRIDAQRPFGEMRLGGVWLPASGRTRLAGCNIQVFGCLDQRAGLAD